MLSWPAPQKLVIEGGTTRGEHDAIDKDVPRTLLPLEVISRVNQSLLQSCAPQVQCWSELLICVPDLSRLLRLLQHYDGSCAYPFATFFSQFQADLFAL